MNAKQNTEAHINFFKLIGITHIDLLVLEQAEEPKTQYRSCVPIENVHKYFKWLMYMNHKNYNIHIKPSPQYDSSYILLDDLSDDNAKKLSALYRTLLIRTSVEGGYQAWVETSEPINKKQRYAIQRGFIEQYNADRGCIAGDHFGRLAGFKNIKRAGQWVNAMPVNNVNALHVDIDIEDTPETNNQPAPQIEPGSHDEENLIKALEKIDNSDYHVWLKVGQALQSINRKDLWDAWSATNEKFNETKQDRTWLAMTGSGVTIKSIFWLAQGNH